jgi:hypothetical protein
MNFFGMFFSPWVILIATAGWHLAVLWLLWRMTKALERRG